MTLIGFVWGGVGAATAYEFHEARSLIMAILWPRPQQLLLPNSTARKASRKLGLLRPKVNALAGGTGSTARRGLRRRRRPAAAAALPPAARPLRAVPLEAPAGAPGVGMSERTPDGGAVLRQMVSSAGSAQEGGALLGPRAASSRGSSRMSCTRDARLGK